MGIHRLFFAIWPNDAVRTELTAAVEAIASCRGKRVPPENYHITLAFLGNVAEEQMNCALGLGDVLSGAPFEFRMNQFGYFPKARVAWLGPESCPAAATLLYRRLQAALSTCGLVPEARPFHPHLTLVRKAFHGPKAESQVLIRWPVDDFVLVESENGSDGSVYRLLRRWPLTEREAV